MLASESLETPGTAVVIRHVTDSIRTSASGPINISVESLERSRFPGDDERLVALYQSRYAPAALELVVAVEGPALEFVLRHRDELFRGVPVLFGFVDQGMVQAVPAGAGVSGVLVDLELESLVGQALRLHPRTRNVFVVGGMSEFDRGWQATFRRAAVHFESRVSITYLTDMALRDLLGEVATLPDDSLVIYLSMSRDRAGSVFLPRDVLEMVRRVSRVPIYGPSTTFLGRGVVGGPLMDLDAHGRALGALAVRVLAGTSPSTVQPAITPNRLAYDWREMERFHVPESALPAGAAVLFRPVTSWTVHPGWVVATGVLLGAQTLLIVALVAQRRMRAGLQRALDERLGFGTLISDVAAALAAAPAPGLDSTVRTSLERIRQHFGLDRVSIFEVAPDGEVLRPLGTGPGGGALDDCVMELTGIPYVALRLASFQAIAFTASETLPVEAAEGHAALRGAGILSVALIPMEIGGREIGVLACASRAREVPWPPERLRQVQSLAEVVANAVQRRQSEVVVAESDRLRGAILSSIAAHIAVVDRAGVIIAVNDAWIAFGRANGVRAEASISPGANYLEECQRAAQEGSPGAAEALEGLRAVCDGRRPVFEREYEMEGTHPAAFFSMKVMPLRRAEGGAVVTHREVTAERRQQAALRDLSGRLMTAQEDERRRIARELHDDLQQRLALLAIELDGAALERSALGDEAGAARARKLWTETTGIATDIHRMSHRLHPSKLEALGLPRTIEGYCRELAHNGLRVTFAHDRVPGEIPPDTALGLFRVVQEALHNVVKHSGAAEARVTLAGDGGVLRLEVSDTGHGFDAAEVTRAGGLGIVSMRERMHLVGGELTIESAAGAGTRIAVRVPLDGAGDAAPAADAVGARTVAARGDERERGTG